MATDVERMEGTGEEMAIGTDRTTVAAIGGGIAAGIVMGLLLTDSMTTIGGLIGVSTVLGGWALHMVIAVALAIVFGAALRVPALSEYADGVLQTTLLGAVYGGVVLTVVTGGIGLPLWANAVLDAGLAVPTITTESFLNHLVYGIVLGAVLGLVRNGRASVPW